MSYLLFRFKSQYKKLLTNTTSVITDQIGQPYVKLRESNIFSACEIAKQFSQITNISYHNFYYHSTLNFNDNNSSLYNPRDTSWEECDFSQAVVLNFNVRGGKAKDCNLKNTKFDNCFFHDFKFINSNLTQAEFHNCSIQGTYGTVIFNKCILDRTIFNFTNQYSNCTDKLCLYQVTGKDIVMRNNQFTHNEVYIQDSDITGDFTGTYFGILLAPQKFKFYFIKQGGTFGNMNFCHELFHFLCTTIKSEK